MLTTLRIRNLALVEELTLELQPGYNAITGETGAGKSILIGALNLVLGERADRTLIRAGAEQCAVEAVFDLGKRAGAIRIWLENHGLEADPGQLLVLKRSIAHTGANRQFINGAPTTLNVLAELGQELVDIHGPHDHQSLLQPARQLIILDAFGNLHGLRNAFADLVQRRKGVEREKTALIIDERTYAQQLDLLRHQVREIESARLRPDEAEALELEYGRASNAARLLQLAQTAAGLLGGEENSIANQMAVLGRTLQELERTDATAKPLMEQLEQVSSFLQDLQRDLTHYSERLELDPDRLQELETRLNLLRSLQRKYGPGISEILAFGAEARRKLESLEQRDAELARLNGQLQTLDRQILEAGQELTARRRKLIPRLSKAVAQQLGDLGFKQSQFEILLQSQSEAEAWPDLNATGFDSIEFLFAPNPGEPARPLRAIASSGEMARVMLALKTVLAAEDEIPVLVFDEVDANVGGETARAVGEKMVQIARNRQVLCITHLAPVAAQALTHFVVSKNTSEGRTLSTICRLEEESDRITELARMLGGQSHAARQHAADLLKSSAGHNSSSRAA